MSTTLPIPTDFVCSYNGFTHDPATALTTALSVKVVESADGRTASYNQIYLRVSSEVHGSPTDAAVLAARQRLTKYGGVLVYDGRGFGPLKVNTGRVRDIKFGPKPKMLSVKFLGSKYACRLDWEVEVHIPECADARYSLRFLDLSYRMESAVQPGGRVNRVVSGTLKIPNNRVRPGSDEVLDSPDLYRERIAPPVPYWFRREWAPWKVDESRTSLQFGWTDKELGQNAYPPGVARIEAPHGVQQDGTGAVFVKAQSTIRARITLDAGYDATVAQRAFAHIVRRRVVDRQDARLPGRDGHPVTYLAHRFEANESDIFSQDTECELAFTYVILATSLDTLLRDTGLWEPVYGKPNDWTAWYQSVRNSSLSPYGVSRVMFSPESDQIVDLCQANPAGLRPLGAARPIQQRLVGGVALPPIQPVGSWIDYFCYLAVETDTGTVHVRPLAQSNPAPAPPTSTPAELKGGTLQPREQAPTPRPVAADPKGYESLAGTIADKVGRVPAFGHSAGGTGGSAGSGKGNPPPAGTIQGKSPPGPGDVAVQRRTPPFVALYLIGEAQRVGFEIPPPSLGPVDGLQPIPANRLDHGEGFVTGIVGVTANGIPIYGAKWRLRYVLPQQPTGPVLPPDPASWLGRRLG